MVSINTSSSQSSIGFVRIENDYSHEVDDYPLYYYVDVKSSIDIVSERVVYENYPYTMKVFILSEFQIVSIDICINGASPISSFIAGTSVLCLDGKEYVEYCADSFNVEKYIFRLTYGFVRIEAIASESNCRDNEDVVMFTTKDIPCLVKDDHQMAVVEAMLEELLDKGSETVSRWMFAGGEDRQSDYSLFEAGLQSNVPKSISSMIQLFEKAIVEYEDNYAFFRSHGYRKIRKEKKKLPQRMIRQAGMPELMWICKNSNVLRKTLHETNIEYRGTYYLPYEVETNVKVKTYNSYENKLVLGFLNTLVASARNVLNGLEEQSQSIYELEKKLNKINQVEYSFPGLALIQLCARREKDYINKLRDIVFTLRAIQRKYEKALSDAIPSFTRNPKKTKIFQEVKQYSEIYSLIIEWLKFGDFTLAREMLALHSPRLDKLYEYYVLLKILSWFESRGFKEDPNEEHPIECLSYSLDYVNYADEKKVSTSYKLAKEGVKIRLYYQPVIYGDLREENGIKLHRLSKRKGDSFWTPDYLVLIDDGSGSLRWHVFDAKYSKINDLWNGFPEKGNLVKAISKYKTDINSLPENGKIESVWLLCGRDTAQNARVTSSSSWCMAHRFEYCSGIGIVTPFHSCLDCIMKAMLQSSVALLSIDGSHLDDTNTFVPNSETTNSSLNNGRGIESSLMKDLYKLIEDKELLYNSRWAEKNLGISHPLLRKTAPKGREQRLYTKEIYLGETCYIYSNWLPTQKNKLISYIGRVRKTVQ